jgi:hypothetical protein
MDVPKLQQPIYRNPIQQRTVSFVDAAWLVFENMRDNSGTGEIAKVGA